MIIDIELRAFRFLKFSAVPNIFENTGSFVCSILNISPNRGLLWESQKFLEPVPISEKNSFPVPTQIFGIPHSSINFYIFHKI